jgi:hypothetical protein
MDLVGTIGFQINDTWTTFIAVRTGAMEGNKIFKFLSEGKVIDFIIIGAIKVLFAVFLYVCALLNPAFKLNLEYDFYIEVGVTLWNILTIYRHKTGR